MQMEAANAEHFACARSGPFPVRSRSVPRSVFGPAFPELDVSSWNVDAVLVKPHLRYMVT